MDRAIHLAYNRPQAADSIKATPQTCCKWCVSGYAVDFRFIFQYDMIHVTPPMSAPLALRQSTSLSDSKGFLDVHQYTLQHKRYPNVFGLGDCVNTPNGKTAAAVAGQLGVVMNNLSAYIHGKSMNASVSDIV